MQSGAVNAHWAKPNGRTYFPVLFRQVASRVGCPASAPVQQIVNCLKKVPYRQLIDTYNGADVSIFADYFFAFTDKFNS